MKQTKIFQCKGAVFEILLTPSDNLKRERMRREKREVKEKHYPTETAFIPHVYVLIAMPNYPAMAITEMWQPRVPQSPGLWDTSRAPAPPSRLATKGHRGIARRPPWHGRRLRRRRAPLAGLKARSRSEGGLRELRELQKLRPLGPGPVALGEEPLLLSSPHPHRPPACGRRRFPSLGFEPPALTNRCLPAPAARRLRGAERPGRASGPEGTPARLVPLLTLYTSVRC